MEQTRLFQRNLFFYYADFRDWNCDWFFRMSSAGSEKFWVKSTKISHRMNMAIRLHCAENRQSQSLFFSGSGWSLCAWRNNQYILAAETVITNAACATSAFIYSSLSSMSTPCLRKKLCKFFFCQNFVKFPPIFVIFGRKMAKRLKLCEVHSISTSPNSRHHTTVLNTDVPNCYTTLKVVIFNKLSSDLISTQ